MAWKFVLYDLAGGRIGAVENPYERHVYLPLEVEEFAIASFKTRDYDLVRAITDLNGDVLCVAYQGSTVRFTGELTTLEEVGPNYRRILDRQQLLTRCYALPQNPETDNDAQSSADSPAIIARGLYEEVIPTDVQNSALRKALCDLHISVRKQAKETVSYEPSSNEGVSFACNFVSPAWRLQKRLFGRSTDGVTFTGQRAVMIRDRLTAANDDTDTGIREGLTPTTVTLSGGTYRYKPVLEQMRELATTPFFPPLETPGSYAADDDFDQPVGALHTKPLPNPSGKLWNCEDGNGNDFNIVAGHWVERAAVSDPDQYHGRYAIVGSSGVGFTFSDILVRINPQWSVVDANGAWSGVICRYTNDTNWLRAHYFINGSNSHVTIEKMVSGTATVLADIDIGVLSINTGYPIVIRADADGRCWCWAGTDFTLPIITAEDSDLATGGPLASGRIGFYDARVSATAMNRVYDGFWAAVPTVAMTLEGVDLEFAPSVPTVDGDGVKVATLNQYLRMGTSRPNAIFEYGTGKGMSQTEPVFGTDYYVGDTVTVRSLVDGEVSFNGTVRVYAVDITVDDEGKETVVPKFVTE